MVKKRRELETVKVEVVAEQTPVKTIPLKRALSVWRKKNPERAMFLDDAEAVEMFAKRTMPSLQGTQEEFDQVFDKY